MNANTNTTTVEWSELLKEAVDKPGSILEAYSNFHSYSIGNCMLAARQCHMRGIPLGPIATYKRWQELGRQVRRGEKALTLCMPQYARIRDSGGEDEEPRTYFVYRRRWLVLAQTDGEAYELLPSPEWDKKLALRA